MADPLAPDHLPATRRLSAVLLPLGAAGLALALAARWTGREDHVALYMLAILVLLLTTLLGLAHMLGRGMRTAEQRGFRNAREAFRYDAFTGKGLDPKAVSLMIAAIVILMYTGRGAPMTGSAALIMATALSAMVLVGVTRRRPVDERGPPAK